MREMGEGLAKAEAYEAKVVVVAAFPELVRAGEDAGPETYSASIDGDHFVVGLLDGVVVGVVAAFVWVVSGTGVIVTGSAEVRGDGGGIGVSVIQGCGDTGHTGRLQGRRDRGVIGDGGSAGSHLGEIFGLIVGVLKWTGKDGSLMTEEEQKRVCEGHGGWGRLKNRDTGRNERG